MKEVVTFLCLMTACILNSQNLTPLHENIWIERAALYRISGDGYNEMISNYNIYRDYPETLEGRQALVKSDSLKNVLRINLIRDLQGTWKLTKAGSGWGYTDITDNISNNLLVVDGKTVTFYNNDLKSGIRTKTKTENIQYTELITGIYHVLNFLYADKTIWSYRLKGNILHITEVGEIEGDSIITTVCGNMEYFYEKIATQK